MNIAEEEINLIVKIAQLYYDEGKTQEEIAKLLGMSRVKVLRLLKKAKENGLVITKVMNPLITCKDLEQELESKFNLEKAIVVFDSYLPEELLRQEIGRWGANLLQSIVEDDDIIGVGWGATVYECVKQLKTINKENVIVVSMGGGTGQIKPIFQVNELVKEVAKKFSGKSYLLDVPIFFENIESKKLLIKEPRVKKILNLWKNLTVALVGIGNMESLWRSYSPLMAFSENAIEVLKKELSVCKGVGDIVSNFFDANGNILPISIRENILSISIEMIKNIKKVIAVSGGKGKEEAILGALQGGYIKYLVTDESVAKYLISSKPDVLVNTHLREGE